MIKQKLIMHKEITLMNAQYVKFFRESLVALGITVFGELITGSLWGSFYAKFIIIAGIIALIPVIGENRGNISGIFTARLGTGLHLGSMKPSFKDRSKELNNTIYMNIILTLSLPIWTSFVVYVFHFFSGGTTSYFDFLFVAIGAACILVCVQPILTLAIAFIVYIKGLDPDVVVYPITSVIADVMTSLAIYIVLSIEIAFFNFDSLHIPETLVEVVAIAYFIIFLLITFIHPIRARSRLEFELFDLLKEALPIVMVSIIIGSIVGLILDNTVSYTGIILILPIFMSFTGATGSVIGSKFTTTYYLGSLSTRSGKIEMYLFFPLILVFVSFILSTTLGIVGYLLATSFNFTLPDNTTFISFVLSCSLIGIITAIIAIIIALVLGTITFRRGLDADNVIVPLSTTLGDLIAILSVIFVTGLIL